ncbi:MAG: hypothetical protein ACJAUP_002186 [Cellvibrionaceae bacterium]|jgi:hypothetical protein
MALKKDKQKVLGEVFNDERIRSFLNYEAYGDNNPDYHLLEKAYRGMNVDNFSTFIHFFTEAGYDLNAKSLQGNTFLETISTHQQAQNYIKVLKQSGAE